MKLFLQFLAATLLLIVPSFAAPSAPAPGPAPAVVQITNAKEQAALKRLEKADVELAEAKAALGTGEDPDLTAARDAAQDEYDAALTSAREVRDAGDGNSGELGLAIYDITSDGVDASAAGLANMVTKWTGMAKDWLINDGPGWGIRLLIFLLIVAVFKVLAGVGGKITGKALSSSKLKVTDLLRNFFVGIVQKLIFFAGLLIALGQLGVDTGPLLAGIGVVGFVVGFALQDTLSNFASGIMILLYRPYDVGHVITAGGETGKVSDMSLVSTTMLTPDNQKLIIPNSSIWGGVIRNVSAQTTRRVDLTIGVGYGDDLDLAGDVLMEVVCAHEKVLKDPAPAVKVTNLGESSVDFVVRPWVNAADYWDVYWDLTKAIKQRDLHLIEVPEKMALVK